MKISAISTLAGACALVLTASAATGQEKRADQFAEATIYRDGGYRGPALAVSDAKPDLELPWPINSIRVASGRWILCEQTQYRGNCRTIDSDTPLLGSLLRGVTIQSMRPEGSPVGQIGVEAKNQSLRGTFAELHTQPGVRGYRIPACPTGRATANCAARTADNYCRTIGWNGSAREHLETVGRIAYLADVLCVRSNF